MLRLSALLLALVALVPGDALLWPAPAAAAELKQHRCTKAHAHHPKAKETPRKAAEKRGVILFDRSVRQMEILSFGP